MTKKMKTVCIGRFLVDLPSETRFGLRGPRIDGLDISSVDESEADFQVRLAQREAELRATPDRLGGYRNLASVREVKTDNGVVGKIFVHGYTVREGTRNSGLELERYRLEGIAIEAMVHGQGMSFALRASNYNPDNIEDLPRLVAKLVPNPQLPSHPHFEFLTILSAGNKPSSQSLLERSADMEARLTFFQKYRVSHLRAHPRTIGGMTGDELIRRVAEINYAVVYSFWWEVNGTDDKVFVPHFVFKMTTGEGERGPVPSSLSQDAAMALWDRITSSIRFHTPVPAKRARRASPNNASAKSSRLPEA